MISYLVNPRQVTVIVKGRPYTVNKDDRRYDTVMSLIKDKDEDSLNTLLNKIEGISKKLAGLSITNEGIVTYVNKEGVEDVLPPALNKTIVAMYEQDVDSLEPLIKFWEKLKLNPSYRINRCLFDFIEANNIVINDNGNLIMYKIVGRTDDKEVFVDLYSHNIKQKIGQVIEIARNQVDDDIQKTCSFGLHAAIWNYLPHYGSCVNEKDAIILVEIDPQDIVAIPPDYNNSKIRTCKYVLLEEYFYKDGEMKDVLYRSYSDSNNNVDLDLDDDDEDDEYTFSDYDYDDDDNEDDD